MTSKIQPYEDLNTVKWWKSISPLPSTRLAHRQVSDALWYSLLQAAHAHYFRFLWVNNRKLESVVKHRQVHRARAFLEAVRYIVHEMLNLGILESKPEAYAKLCEYVAQADAACTEVQDDTMVW